MKIDPSELLFICAVKGKFRIQCNCWNQNCKTCSNLNWVSFNLIIIFPERCDDIGKAIFFLDLWICPLLLVTSFYISYFSAFILYCFRKIVWIFIINLHVNIHQFCLYMTAIVSCDYFRMHCNDAINWHIFSDSWQNRRQKSF